MIFGSSLFGGGPKEIEFVASAANPSAASTNVVNAPSGSQGGDLIVIVIVNNTTTFPSSLPSGFTKILESNDGISDTTITVIAGPYVPGVSSYTVGWPSGVSSSVAALAYRSFQPIKVVGFGTVGRVTSGAVSAPSITLPFEGVLLAAFGANGGGADFASGPAGMVQRSIEQSVGAICATYDLNPAVAGSTGSKSQSFTASYNDAVGVLLHIG